MFMYIVYLGAVFLATVFPLPALYWIARRIADLHHLFDAKGRVAVKGNLQVIANGELDEKALKKAVKQVYYHFSLYLAEFFRMKKLDREYFESQVKIVGNENVDTALELGRGVVVTSAHYSNWELGLVYFCMSGYDPYVIIAPHKNEKVNDLFLGPRIRAGARVIYTSNALEGGYEALRNNGILVVLADRVTTKGGAPTTFFGHKAMFPKGPARFAIGAHAPLITAYIRRKPDNTFILTFDEPIYTDDLGDDEESVQLLMDKYTRKLESFIKNDPTHYTVFYKIWKDADNPSGSIQNKNPV